MLDEMSQDETDEVQPMTQTPVCAELFAEAMDDHIQPLKQYIEDNVPASPSKAKAIGLLVAVRDIACRVVDANGVVPVVVEDEKGDGVSGG